MSAVLILLAVIQGDARTCACTNTAMHHGPCTMQGLRNRHATSILVRQRSPAITVQHVGGKHDVVDLMVEIMLEGE